MTPSAQSLGSRLTWIDLLRSAASISRAVARGAVVVGCTVALLAPALPALAAAPPVPATGLSRQLGAHGLQLSWSGHGTGTTLVRAVAGPTPPSLTQGNVVQPSTPTTAYDTGFTNTATRSYSVWATDADGTPSVTPATLTVAPLPRRQATLTLTASPTTVLAGRPATLVGRLRRTSDGLPLAGASVTVRRQVLGSSTLILVGTVTTAADGSVGSSLTASRSVSYSLRYAGDAFLAAATSLGQTVRLQPQVSAALGRTTLPSRASTTLFGAVRPAYAGVAVVVQTWSATGWHDARILRTTASGTWATTVSPGIGRTLYRTVLAATTTHLQAISPNRLLQVLPRTLVTGSSGSDVLALERQLARLHYLVGAQDGYYDRDLEHAIITFEKVEGLARNGTWGAAERARAQAPHGFRLRFPGTGRAVEVDITRQVLVLSQGGSIVRIVDVSTGSERHYLQEGVDNVAHTPRGRFHVIRKIDGVHISPLGTLYRPSFFFEGFAVHGNDSVPTYNASHGCVRVTNTAADLLFPLLTIGTPLAVYDE